MRHGMIRNPAFLTLLALGAMGCPDDPEPAGTGPDCKKGERPVDEPLPSDPTIAAPAPPAPAPASQLRGAGGGSVFVDEASHTAELPPAPMQRAGRPTTKR